jgi:RNA-directed DNA polymerase
LCQFRTLSYPQSMLTATEAFTKSAIETAYTWLCKSRANFPANADIWHLRFHWPIIRAQLVKSLNDQSYTMMPLSVVIKANGKIIHLWSSQDALVLKMLAMSLPSALGLSSLCTYIKGHGGLKATVNAVQAALPAYAYVMKTDVKRYYESIDHTILLKQFDKHIADPFIWRLLVQFVKRTVEYGGNFTDVKKGISRGCSLSPVIAAYYLTGLDEQMASDNRCFYIRYMDDIIVLAKNHWQLRKVVRVVNQAFNSLKVEQAPDKTFIGRIEKGFDFLGYRFGQQGLALAEKTVLNTMNRMHRLYEQKKTACLDKGNAACLGAYWRRWLSWAGGGLAVELNWLLFDGKTLVPIDQPLTAMRLTVPVQ